MKRLQIKFMSGNEDAQVIKQSTDTNGEKMKNIWSWTSGSENLKTVFYLVSLKAIVSIRFSWPGRTLLECDWERHWLPVCYLLDRESPLVINDSKCHWRRHNFLSGGGGCSMCIAQTMSLCFRSSRRFGAVGSSPDFSGFSRHLASRHLNLSGSSYVLVR